MKLWPEEGGCHELVQVTLVGQFGLPQIATSLPTETLPQEVGDPGAFHPSKASGTAPYRMIRVNFFGVVDSWAFNSIDHVPLEDHFEFPETDGQNLWKKWQSTGLCPDPLMYEVHPVLGLKEPETVPGEFVDVVRVERIRELQPRCRNNPNLKHYLLLGHDINVEVIAEKWNWDEGQGILGWQ